MRPIPSLALAAVVLAAGACRAVPRAVYATLETRASAPVVYEAELTSRAARIDDSEHDWMPAVEADEPWSDAPDEACVDIHTRLVALRAQDAAGAFGYRRHGKQAVLVDRAAAERLLDRMIADGVAKDVNNVRLATRAGVPASISTINQTAYIESFRVEAQDDVLIADPNVGVARDGLVVTIEPSPLAADGSIDLSIEVVYKSLARPIATIEASIPGSSTPVTLQTPLTMSQKLATVVRLGPGDALVLGGLAGDAPDEFLFAIVTAEPLALEPSELRADVDR